MEGLDPNKGRSRSPRQERLERAYTLLTEISNHNEPITLDQFISEVIPKGSHGLGASNQKVGMHLLKLGKFLPFPQKVAGIASTGSRFFMGSFPEINRVWFTIDSKLLLWNYSPGASNPLTEYSEQKQIILNVGLIKPKKGVFLDQVEYLIVVVTFFEISILSVVFSKKGDCNGDMTIYKTDMCIPTEHVLYTKILGSSDGRLFLGGSNGDVCEILYQRNSGWFSDNIRKVNHMSSYWSMILPTILERRSRKAVKDLVLDEGRKLLYILRGLSDIQVVYLGEKGDKFIICKEIKGSEISEESKCNSLIIKGLFVVPRVVSKLIELVAITAKGDRMFFSLYNTDEEGCQGALGKLAPTAFKSVCINKENRKVLSILVKFKDVYFSSGLTLGVCTSVDKMEKSDSLWCMAPSIGEIFKSQSRTHFEYYDNLELECDVRNIFNVSRNAPYDERGGIFGNFSTQEFGERWTFCLLTNIGLQFFSVLRPMDQLYELLATYGYHNKDYYAEFASRCDYKVMLSMLLELACSQPHKNDGEYDELGSINQQVQESAISLYHQYSQLRQPVRSLSLSNECTMSSSVMALVIYAIRLLEPFWYTKVLAKFEEILGPDNIFKVIGYKRKMEKLSILLEKRIIPNIKGLSSAESEYLTDILSFLSRACEILSLLIVFKDSNYSQFDTGLSPTQKQYLQSLSFEDLVWTQEGNLLIQNILSTFIRKILSSGTHLSPIEKLLRASCPSIYTEGSKMFSKGWSNIIKALDMNENSPIRRKFLELSAEYFKNEMLDMLPFQFVQIIEEYKCLMFYQGMIELTISWAYKHPTNLNLNGNMVEDNLSDQIDCLEIIKIALKSIKAEITSSKLSLDRQKEIQEIKAKVLSKILSVSNKKFLFSVYPILIEELHKDILKLDPPFIEEFLLNLNDESNKFHMLSLYYSLVQRHSEAAVCYSNIAELPGCKLEDRIKNFTYSLFSWRSSQKNTLADQHMMEDVEIRLKISHIQYKILQTLESRQDMDKNSCNELRTGLLSLSRLYNDYAVPFKLNDISDEILKLSCLEPEGHKL